jgi:GDP-L-fucose synthase
MDLAIIPTDVRCIWFCDLIRKIMRGKLFGEPVVLWGDGYQSRELVYVDDFVRIMLQVVDECENDLINIYTRKDDSIRHFAQTICDKVEYDVNVIRFDTTRYVGAKAKCLTTSKLKHLLPELTLASLEQGLQKTVEWFCEKRVSLLQEEREMSGG